MSEVPMDKKCGAKVKMNGQQPCHRLAMVNGRCYLHGGKSTGAKTPEGKLRQKMPSWKHGMQSKERIEESEYLKQMLNIFLRNLSL